MPKKRKGLAVGQGKGFKNVLGQDSKTHSDSAKGIKQPQSINVEALTRQSQLKGQKVDTDKILAQQEEGLKRSDIIKERARTTGKKALEFSRQKLKDFQESRRQSKIKTLEEVNHPITTKLDKQKSRVAELETQISQTKDPAREERLFDELREEQMQLRELQEKASEIVLSDFSDRELKTLAIRHKDESLFFGSDNPYEAELVRRIRAQKRINQSLADARKEKPEENLGLFDGIF